jgi:peptidoglycan lytic transglycosylase
MQVIKHILAVVLLICAGLALPVAPTRADDAAALARALTEMRSEDWDQAARKAGPRGSIGRDIIEWHRLREGLGSPADVLAFLERRPDWPGLAWLRRKSELTMARAGIGERLKFYETVSAQTAEGALSLATALLATGHRGDGEAEIVLAWRTRPMGSGLQARVLKEHGKLLKPHHIARLDRLLWDGHLVSARRMLPLVPDNQRKLAEARIALQDTAPGVDARIAAVPDALKSDPGLAYDRFAWRDRKRRQEDAITLMIDRSTDAETLGEPGKWARRRRDLARQDMRDKKYERAYQLAAYHHTTPEIGYSYADLEWIAGYVALRFLNDPKTAVAHFKRFEAAVETPISKGRAGYWLGRAHAAAGQADLAHDAFALGAQYQTSFYGLLAAEQIGRPFDPRLASPPAHPDWRNAVFMGSSVAEAGLMLLSANDLTQAERFLTHLVESLPADQAEKLGAMAVDLNQPHLALMIAKRAARSGQILHEAYYPMHPVADQRLPMAKEMTLAIARRESEFDPVVVSGAGARGLMQVMPATAKLVATELGILSGHATSRLTREWKYNAKLGANYLAGLAADFDGNVVMMAAGYNAGPRRPMGWMERYGDPRDGTPDIVDWIEHIPFNETRNYVMRVTESLPVYRARLGKEPLPIPFSRELAGSSLRAFAP